MVIYFLFPFLSLINSSSLLSTRRLLFSGLRESCVRIHPPLIRWMVPETIKHIETPLFAKRGF